MSIRTLTARLKGEAAEAHRRQNFRSAGALADGSPEAPAPSRPREVAGQSIVSSVHEPVEGASLQPPDMHPAENVAAPVRTVGIHSRQQKSNWGIPGGIAERFALQDRMEGQDRPEGAETSESAPSEAATTSTTPDSVPEEQKRDASEQDAPITIELQSH